jgi:hypothetical protein
MDSRLTSDPGPFAPAYPLWTAHLDCPHGLLASDPSTGLPAWTTCFGLPALDIRSYYSLGLLVLDYRSCDRDCDSFSTRMDRKWTGHGSDLD